MHVPPARLCLALVTALCAAAPVTGFTQSDPIVEPLPGEPMIEPLDENGAPIAAPEGDPVPPAEAAPPPEPTPMTRAEYAAALRELVRATRGEVEDSILAKIEDKQAARMDTLAAVLSAIALGGLLMLLAPLILRRRYPGRGGVLWKYSAISAAMFFLAVNLFALVLVTMRGAQNGAGELTNPQVQVVKATFELFEEKADELAVVGPELVEPTLQSLTAETTRPVLSIMLDNVSQLRADVGVFASVGEFFGKLDWAFGLLPMVLVLLALLLFIQAARPTLTEIVKLPVRAAEADDRRGLSKALLGATFRSVWQELKATGGLLVVLIALSAIAGACLSLVLQPAIEIFMAYLALALVYVQVTEAASSFWILFSLVATILFLVANLVVVVAATVLFLGKVHKILQLRFRNGVPLGTHRRFWIWGGASLALLFGLPVLYILIAEPLMGEVVVRFFSETNWARNLGLGPALFLVTFGVIFWAARGVKGLGLLATYRPQTAGGATAPVNLELELEQGPLATSWQTAQAALRQPPAAGPDYSGSDLPTAWVPTQTGMGPDAYPQLQTGAPLHLQQVPTPPLPAPRSASEPAPHSRPPRARTVPPPPPQPKPQPQFQPQPKPRARTAPPPPLTANSPRDTDAPLFRPSTARVPASPPLPRAPRVAGARPKAAPPHRRRAKRPPSEQAPLALPLPDPSPPNRRVARGTGSPPTRPSKLNSAPPPAPISATHPELLPPRNNGDQER